MNAERFERYKSFNNEIYNKTKNGYVKSKNIFSKDGENISHSKFGIRSISIECYLFLNLIAYKVVNGVEDKRYIKWIGNVPTDEDVLIINAYFTNKLNASKKLKAEKKPNVEKVNEQKEFEFNILDELNTMTNKNQEEQEEENYELFNIPTFSVEKLITQTGNVIRETYKCFDDDLVLIKKWTTTTTSKDNGLKAFGDFIKLMDNKSRPFSEIRRFLINIINDPTTKFDRNMGIDQCIRLGLLVKDQSKKGNYMLYNDYRLEDMVDKFLVHRKMFTYVDQDERKKAALALLESEAEDLLTFENEVKGISVEVEKVEEAVSEAPVELIMDKPDNQGQILSKFPDITMRIKKIMSDNDAIDADIKNLESRMAFMLNKREENNVSLNKCTDAILVLNSVLYNKD